MAGCATVAPDLVLARHGETEWTITGQHTSRTDIPLTEHGREQAREMASALAARDFALVLTSPLQRAAETCRLAGFGDRAVVCDDLVEWDYGEYEGRTTAEIRAEQPGWSLWRDGAPGGETAADVGRRVDRVIQVARAAPGDVLAFAHGHVLRVLAARWLELAPTEGRLFLLGPARISDLGWERESPVVTLWNAPPT
jgi:probable phosphoglycerate mutase